ncbi:MAG: LysM peptidoglycan-binding domain-containing protein [Acidobacteria bacterium]|jgi:nucleoid-associated protein YgaU|nr:LysM peptidoglycan-binding domain-containing protein [Acidobacteriota bacterium]
MGLFGPSLEKQVERALGQVRGMGLEVRALGARVEGKTVTLTGETESMEVKTKIMAAFSGAVKADNIFNAIKVIQPEPAPQAPAPAPAPAERTYEVQPGDTLSAIAQRFYGSASSYMKIFEANRNILDNPDLIKVGQVLKIPE